MAPSLDYNQTLETGRFLVWRRRKKVQIPILSLIPTTMLLLLLMMIFLHQSLFLCSSLAATGAVAVTNTAAGEVSEPDADT